MLHLLLLSLAVQLQICNCEQKDILQRVMKYTGEIPFMKYCRAEKYENYNVPSFECAFQCLRKPEECSVFALANNQMCLLCNLEKVTGLTKHSIETDNLQFYLTYTDIGK